MWEKVRVVFLTENLFDKDPLQAIKYMGRHIFILPWDEL